MQQNVSEGMVKHADEIFLEKTTVRTGILLQLFLTHGMTSALALAGVFVLTHLGISLPISIIGTIAISGSLGLFLTINIHYNVHLIERAVIAISEGQPATIPTFSWPLTQLFTHLQTLDRRVQMYVQGEQAAAEIRRQYLHQASETATRTERQRIARDLHDSIKQQLFSISVSASAVKAYWSKDISKAQAAITDIQRVVKEAQVEMQALLQQLGSTPLENTGLADALRTQAEALKYRSGLEMELTLGDLPADELLPEGTQETIFRLAQEAFANIARHARAKAVTLTLQQTERALHLIISDNGKGFDAHVARAGMGLTNMRERVAALNGTIEVQSALDQGTTLHIVIPFLQIQPSVEGKTLNERELKQGMERARNGFQIGITAQSIALAFIGSNIASNISNLGMQIPNAAIVICMLITGYGLWQGHSWKMRLLLHQGKENLDMLMLQQKEEKVLLYLLYTLFAGGFYFLALQKGWDGISKIVFSSVLCLLFAVLLILLIWRGYRTKGRMYRALPPDEVHLEITYQRRTITRYMRVLISGTLGTLIIGGRLLANQQLTSTDKWSLIVGALILCIGGGIVWFNFIMLRQRQQTLEGTQKKVSWVSLVRGRYDDQ